LSNVFISYAKKDEEVARVLSDSLQRAGFSVWWDRYIPPGQTWDNVIGSSLEAADCVLVLWSSNSVASRWVREEADRGARRGCLIPVLIEKVEPPFGFGRIESADLCTWHGDEHDPEFTNLRAAVSDLVRAAGGERGAPPMRVSPAVNPADTHQPVIWDPDYLEKVTQSLARHLGPIAGVLVDRTSKRVASRQQLYDALVTHIASEKDRVKFLQSVPK
jgi:hypothetical protein